MSVSKAVELKLCGIASPQMARLGLEFKEFSYFGLIFAPSPRQVDLCVGAEIAMIVKEQDKKCVGVFVDASSDEILKTCQSLGLAAAQLHIKNKDVAQYASLKHDLNTNGILLWQALSVGKSLPCASIEADFVLYDSAGARAGGNGTSFDWELLKGAKTPFGLAGGIGAHNIAKALQSKASLIDLNSALESSPGVKDRQKIVQLIAKMREQI